MARRGAEGIEFLTKDHVKVLTDEDTGERYIKKVLGEESKNHKHDSEDMENGGIILFEENDVSFNPRLFFHCFGTQ